MSLHAPLEKAQAKGDFHQVFNASDTTIKISIILPPCIRICGDIHPEIILYCTPRVKNWVLHPVHPENFTVHPEDLRQIRPTFQTGIGMSDIRIEMVIRIEMMGVRQLSTKMTDVF